MVAKRGAKNSTKKKKKKGTSTKSSSSKSFNHSDISSVVSVRDYDADLLLLRDDASNSDADDSTVEFEENSPTIKLQKSIFHDREPTIFFQYAEHTTETRLEDELTIVKPLKHRLNYRGGELHCLRDAFKNNGIKKLINGKYWNINWGRHLDVKKLQNLLPCQVINHFPGSWNLGRKDQLGRNLSQMRRKFNEEFDVFAKTFVLPEDWIALKREIDVAPKSLWIVKPSASACGRGIKVVQAEKVTQYRKAKHMIVQQYIDKPFLINGHKFDLRVYILVTSFDPLRVYIYDNGLVRFCTAKYSTKVSQLKNRYRHLTNYSVNKGAAGYVANTSATVDNEGHKWSFYALRDHFKQQGIDYEAVFKSIHEVIVKTLIAAEAPIASHCNRFIPHRGNVFELYGFDIMLDRELKPWVIEVNVSPSLSSSAPLDKKIKNMLMCDVYHLVGVKAVDARADAKTMEKEREERLHSTKIFHTTTTTTKIRRRNVFELQNTNGLTKLTEDEIELLHTLEEEYSRRGHFSRIFPTLETKVKYRNFFPALRYNNALYDIWLAAQNSVKKTVLSYRHPPPVSAPKNSSSSSSSSSNSATSTKSTNKSVGLKGLESTHSSASSTTTSRGELQSACSLWSGSFTKRNLDVERAYASYISISNDEAAATTAAKKEYIMVESASPASRSSPTGHLNLLETRVTNTTREAVKTLSRTDSLTTTVSGQTALHLINVLDSGKAGLNERELKRLASDRSYGNAVNKEAGRIVAYNDSVMRDTSSRQQIIARRPATADYRRSKSPLSRSRKGHMYSHSIDSNKCFDNRHVDSPIDEPIRPKTSPEKRQMSSSTHHHTHNIHTNNINTNSNVRPFSGFVDARDYYAPSMSKFESKPLSRRQFFGETNSSNRLGYGRTGFASRKRNEIRKLRQPS